MEGLALVAIGSPPGGMLLHVAGFLGAATGGRCAVAETVICGPDVDRHVQAIEKFADAGYGHICVHQVGPDQQGFLDFYARNVLPRLTNLREAA